MEPGLRRVLYTLVGVVCTPIALGVLLARSQADQPKVCGIVETVGGCNHNGQCGVKLIDGTIGIADFPVVGTKSCVHITKETL